MGCRSRWFFQYFKYFMPHSPYLHCFWLLFCSNYYFCPSLWLKISHFNFFSSFNIKWLNIVFLTSILLCTPLSSWTCDLLFFIHFESSWFSFFYSNDVYITHFGNCPWMFFVFFKFSEEKKKKTEFQFGNLLLTCLQVHRFFLGHVKSTDVFIKSILYFLLHRFWFFLRISIFLLMLPICSCHIYSFLFIRTLNMLVIVLLDTLSDNS